MKTTILASAALLSAGTLLSNATSVISDPLNDESLVYYWDFSTDSSPVKTVTETTWSDLPTHNSAGYGSYSNVRMWSSTLSAGNIAANSFTVSLDFANFQAAEWQDLLTIYTGTPGYYTSDNSVIHFQKTDSGALAVYVSTAFGGNTSATGTTGGDILSLASNSSWKTITLTSDGTNITVYVDGNVSQTFAYATDSTTLSTFQLGSSFAGNRASTSGDIDNLAIWDRALSADEVRSLVIPEPSAFGLLAGAGALALVASRRRRAK